MVVNNNLIKPELRNGTLPTPLNYIHPEHSYRVKLYQEGTFDYELIKFIVDINLKNGPYYGLDDTFALK
jgi:hypothetical protein